MRFLSSTRTVICLILLAASVALAQVGTVNEVTVPVAGAVNHTITAINVSGTVAGFYDTPLVARIAFIAKKADLSDRVEINLTGGRTEITGIAPNGTSVGIFCSPGECQEGQGAPPPIWHGFIRDKNGSITYWDYPLPAGATSVSTQLSGINDLSQITGSFWTNGDPANQTGFLLDGGVITPITYGAGYKTVPHGINVYGAVVGTVQGSGLPAPISGFVWDGGAFTTFARPKPAPETGYYNTIALGINDKGEVVGHFQVPPTQRTAYLLKYGVFYDFTCEGRLLTDAIDINNKGQIVGTCASPPTQTPVGFITSK